MITYSTNWMGPLSLEWFDQYGHGWAMGRIDIYGGPWPLEIAVPPIDEESWYMLSEWLDTYESEEVDYDILNTFVRKTGRKINFAEGE